MNGRGDLQDFGFSGFVRVSALHESALAEVPRAPGVYAILREAESAPRFTETSSGGHFKDKDPTVLVQTLREKWVAGTDIIYIGKAGHLKKPPTLRTRLKQYLDFGFGRPVGHWGGRYIWQLEDSRELLVCWKETAGEDPEAVELELITAFREVHGRLPFANLTRGTKRRSL